MLLKLSSLLCVSTLHVKTHLYVVVLCRYLEPDLQQLLTEELDDSRLSKKFQKLNKAIASLVSHARFQSKV